MTKTTLLLAGATLLAATAASAQSAKEIYSYKAPSGMFSEGTTKWDMYRFMAVDHEQQEQREAAAARAEADRTASVPSPAVAGRPVAHSRLAHSRFAHSRLAHARAQSVRP
ncbi:MULTISPECIES: hypothetical protein [Methylobacterium]|jgi:hypothetical protein|uniref:Uncharacterized protein n=2 Tax=Methylobacterium TaxID=407 RepID=A0A0C6F1S9_9HYPH|nr:MULTISPECIES: hypothetical protein [Methylobacterium]MBK3400026.1 hypothetical protein [Methylobacterium ajmalii]MBK3409394.1 hypothetical protein [Methylobacterium ajmalii]MBK3422548.1 hypothetical protein [Methylobacterium ajmalii]MBZ6416449.1 hypothetical protein [Methylobacterium sp.]SFF49551.1 hypothetical protein SAMN04487844_12295 [Methylobacterium sp. yr596]